MKTRILTLALALALSAVLAVGHLSAHVNVRTNGAPLIPGTVVHLSWQRPSPTQKSDVDVSYDNGTSWTEIASGLEQDSMEWRIPAVTFTEIRFRVRNRAEVREELELGEICPSDGLIGSRVFVDGGNAMISLETRPQSCRVLRTDMSSLTTTRLWYTNKSSGWGVISPSGKHAVIALKTNELVVLDVTTGATRSIVQWVSKVTFLGESDLFVVHTTGSRLVVYDAETLTIQHDWKLAEGASVGQLCFDNGRLYASLDWQASRYFVPGTDTSHDCGRRLYLIASGLAIDNSSGEFVNLPDLVVDGPISQKYRYVTCTRDARYVVCSISGRDQNSFAIFDRKARTVREISLRSELGTRSLLISSDGRYLIQNTQFEFANIYDLIWPDKMDVHTINRNISCLTPDNEPVSFGVDGAFVYSMSGILKASRIDPFGEVLSFSPTAEHAITRVGTKMVAVKTASRSYFELPCSLKSLRAIRWSADGKSVAIATYEGLTIADMKSRTSRIVVPLKQRVTDKYFLRCTPDLGVVVLLINGRQAIVWRAKDGVYGTVINNGLYWSVYDCKIDLISNRVYLIAKTINEYSPTTLLFSDLGSLHYARPFQYNAKGLNAPGWISGFDVEEQSGRLIILQSLTKSTTAFSKWSSSGELIWTKTYPIGWASLSLQGVVDSLDQIVISNNSGTTTILLRRSDGELISSASTTWLGAVLGEKAHLTMHSSSGTNGPVKVYLAASTFSEYVPLSEDIADRSTIKFESNTLCYRTDTTWKIIHCPAAQFDEPSAFYSEPIAHSAIASVQFVHGELRIDSKLDSPQFEVTILLYDLQGRMLYGGDATDLQPGINNVQLDYADIPHQSVIQILHKDTPMYSGLLIR